MLVSEDAITKIDQARLHLIYEQWPEHFAEASKISCKVDHDPDHYKKITLCGMGGSATSCDILSDLLHSFSNIPSTVTRGQRTSMLDRQSLVIVNSVSGNTAEALLMVEEASAQNAEVICISAGGRMKELAASCGYQHVKIPNLAVPRASLPYLLMPGFKLVEPFLGISIDHSQIYENLSSTVKRISVSVPYEINIAKKISSFLSEGFAFCFASPSLSSVSKRFKNSLNENAKLHCIHESILESCHNEIVPFTYESEYPDRKILFLRWANDLPFINDRFSRVTALLSQLGLPFMELYADETNWIKAVISSIFILDYSTIYMAVSRNVDPSATPAIDILKGVEGIC
ncbi:MAG: SIS domain-containing protein [Thermoproteota archaeon]|nr:SIS domain-containing protein [Thermoproteota archaeon]